MNNSGSEIASYLFYNICFLSKVYISNILCSFLPLARCDSEHVLPGWSLPTGPLCVLWYVTEPKHKAAFHGLEAYQAASSMWDMPGNKGAPLHPPARSVYPFPSAQLFLLDEPMESRRKAGLHTGAGRDAEAKLCLKLLNMGTFAFFIANRNLIWHLM